jgi:hypothetical protein
VRSRGTKENIGIDARQVGPGNLECCRWNSRSGGGASSISNRAPAMPSLSPEVCVVLTRTIFALCAHPGLLVNPRAEPCCASQLVRPSHSGVSIHPADSHHPQIVCCSACYQPLLFGLIPKVLSAAFTGLSLGAPHSPLTPSASAATATRRDAGPGQQQHGPTTVALEPRGLLRLASCDATAAAAWQRQR